MHPLHDRMHMHVLNMFLVVSCRRCSYHNAKGGGQCPYRSVNSAFAHITAQLTYSLTHSHCRFAPFNSQQDQCAQIGRVLLLPTRQEALRVLRHQARRNRACTVPISIATRRHHTTRACAPTSPFAHDHLPPRLSSAPRAT